MIRVATFFASIQKTTQKGEHFFCPILCIQKYVYTCKYIFVYKFRNNCRKGKLVAYPRTPNPLSKIFIRKSSKVEVIFHASFNSCIIFNLSDPVAKLVPGAMAIHTKQLTFVAMCGKKWGHLSFI